MRDIVEDRVLRPELYRRLKMRFGRVSVSSRGKSIEWGLRSKNGRLERYFDKKNPKHTPGEYYAVDCPWCGDTKRRLWINHMWGAYDEITESRNLWLAHCQRRGCLDRYENQKALYSEIFYNGCGQDPVIRRSEYQAPTLDGVDWPGAVWQLTSLPAEHKARQWLRDERHFDPDWLSAQYRIGYLMTAKPRWHFLTGRIIIPIYHEGRYAGWQARFVGKIPEGSDIPKYFTGPGTPRGRLLYSYDLARQQKFGCIVEGPTDVWRFGPEAVAVLGKPTQHQGNLMAMTWQTIVVLLDHDARRESYQLFDYLRTGGKRVVEIDLPVDMDPGDYKTTDELRRFVFNQAQQKGVSLG